MDKENNTIPEGNALERIAQRAEEAKKKAKAMSGRRKLIEAQARPGETFEQAERRFLDECDRPNGGGQSPAANNSLRKPPEGDAQESKKKAEAEQKQLPLWADWERAMPTPISRSALFAPIGRGARKRLKDALIDSRRDVSLTYTGEQLDMGDGDTYMQALELAKRHPLGTEFVVNRAEFLAAIGRAYESKSTSSGKVRAKSIGNKTYDWLDASMKRLREGALDFTIKATAKRKPRGGILNLIKTWKWDDSTNSYLLSIDPEMYKLFESFSRIYLDKHLALPKADQLAKWMHLFIAGCEKDALTKIGLVHLRAYSGCKNRRMDHFSSSLQRAMQALEDAGIIAPGWFVRANDLMLNFTRIL